MAQYASSSGTPERDQEVEGEEEKEESSGPSVQPQDILDREEDESQEPGPEGGRESGAKEEEDRDTDLETDDAVEGWVLPPSELYLRACRLTGAPPIATFLRHSGQGPLALNHRGVGPRGAKALAIALVNLSYNALRPAGASSICRMLVDNVSLKSLQLSETNVGLELLNLSWNHLRLGGVESLCAALKVNTSLKQLDLSWNSLGRGGARVLGDVLRQNNSLLQLDLRSNRLDDPALALLCRGLGANDSLQVLRNPLTDTGVLVLLRTVRSNVKSALEEIDLSTISVNQAFVKLLAKTVEDGSPLEVRYRGVLGSYDNSRSKETSTSLHGQLHPLQSSVPGEARGRAKQPSRLQSATITSLWRFESQARG
ncbi:unnamed protein product [Lota lota]